VTIKPLSQVDEAFAWDEGEGDRTREWWLDAHRRYFPREATHEGFEIDDEILTVFEREAGQRWRSPGRHSLSDINNSRSSISMTSAQ
jgi:hypothetical protein